MIKSGKHHSFWLCLFTIALVAVASTSFAAGAPKFEIPTAVRAPEILPPALLSGIDFSVRDRVVSYGYMHQFVVDSSFGVFQVTGDFALRKLVNEIKALAVLRDIKRSDAYLAGIKNAASQSLEFGANLITDPVDTISAVPKGVAGLFQNIRTGLTSPSSQSEDGKLAQALAVSANKRELASRLGVDVYSSNAALQKELNSLAWATSLGSLTVSAALAPVGGPAVMAVTATRTAQQLSDVVNQFPPARIRQINQEKLQSMGISPDLIAQFLDHPSYTPTHDTVIVQSLEILAGARGRDAFLQQALSANDEESANFFQYVAETMKGYQLTVAPVREISAFGPLVFAKTAAGIVLIPLPIDRGIWTERAAQRVPDAIAAFKSVSPESRKFEVWLTGTASKRVKEEMERRGAKVMENVGKRIEFVY